MISGMVKEITGSYKIPYTADDESEPVIIDFSPPWARIPMIEGLEKELEVKIPPLEAPGTAEFLEKLCEKHNVECRSVCASILKLFKFYYLSMM